MATIAELRERAAAARTALTRRKGQRDQILTDRRTAEAQLIEKQGQVALWDQTITLLNLTGDEARTVAKARIESLVTSALRSVFGGEYGFAIELAEKGGRPEAEFYVTSPFGDGNLMTKPEESRGGGVVDVVSLGTRIAMLETYQPRLEGALIMDEPAKHVSEEFIPLVATFLRRTSEVFGRQVIMVTHDPHLAEAAERIHQVVMRDEISHATTT